MTDRRPERLRAALWPALILLAGIWAYHNTFTVPFLFDDGGAIGENPHIRSLWPVWNALEAPPETTAAGRPLLCLTFALNYAVCGLDVRGYHAFNLAIHLLSGLLLFGLVRRTLLVTRVQHSASRLALTVALVWTTHPLQTGSVTYIVQRAESLMGLLYLLTLYCAIRGFRSHRAGRWHALAVLACTLGMAAKEVMVTAPVLVLLHDRAFLSRSFSRALRRRGLYLGLAASWILLAAILATNPRGTSAGFDMAAVTWWQYLFTQFGVVLHYLGLSLWPHPLVLDHGWPLARSVEDVLPPALAIAALVLLTCLAWRHAPGVGFLGLVFFLVLAPTSSIVPIKDAAFEHRMYLPLIAVVALLVIASHALLSNVLSARPALHRIVSAGIVFAVVVGLSTASVRRNHDFRSRISIWCDTVTKRPENPRAHNNLGFVLAQQGHAREAMIEYATALRLQPDHVDAHNNLGVLLAAHGKVEQGKSHFEKVLAMEPDNAAAHANLGRALVLLGHVDGAIRHFRRALRLRPEDASLLRDLDRAQHTTNIQ